MSALNEGVAVKVRDTVMAGLCRGLGWPEPGKMCVEAVVNHALGLPHGDKSPCIGESVRVFKIALNDSDWPSDSARAKGLLGVAIAQLGSNEINQLEFTKRLTLKVCNRQLPLLFRWLAKQDGTDAPRLNKCADELETATRNNVVSVAGRAADAAMAAWSEADEDWEAARMAWASDAAGAAKAASDAARTAKALAEIEQSDRPLIEAADICLEVLQELDSPGCQWLYLVQGKDID